MHYIHTHTHTHTHVCVCVCVYKGVSLARNVVAKSSLHLAQQHLEYYKVAATESLSPHWEEAVAAARTAHSFAVQAALSFDAQLSDSYLGSTHAAELLRSLLPLYYVSFDIVLGLF